MAPPNPKVVRAFRVMKDIGISEEKVKPVLKKLLKLYDKNWALIEEENYRVLADAIFDEEETKVMERQKSKSVDQAEDFEDESLTHDEPERPLKRLRLRGREGPSSSSPSNCSPRVGGSFSKKPKVEEDEMLATSTQPQVVKSAQSILGNARTELQPVSPRPVSPGPISPRPVSPGLVSPQPVSPGPISPRPVSPGLVSPRPVSPLHHPRNMGNQPVSPRLLALQERTDTIQPNATDRTQPCSTKGSESDSLSSQLRAGYKGKEPFSSYVASRKKRFASERASHAVHAKDPTIVPGIILLPKQKFPDTHALITPKDEPFTDDMLQYEGPIAVIHPDSSNKNDSSVGNVTMGNPNGQESTASLHVERENRGDGVQSLFSERTTNCELATIPEESSSLEIASTPLGEVKISISCNSALGGSNFHVPSIDELRASMEEKCLRSYKIIDPNFSVMKLMKDMCECFLELATNSSHESQDRVMNITPNFDLLKKSAARDVLAVGGKNGNIDLTSSAANGSVDVQCPGGVDEFQVPRPLLAVGGQDDHMKSNKVSVADGCAESDRGKEVKDPELSNSCSLVVVPQCQLTPDELRSLHDFKDITKGEERVEISWVNGISNDCPPSFYYIPQNLVFQNASVNFSLSRIGDENCCPTCFGDCLSSAIPCACAYRIGAEFAYTSAGLVNEEFLEECISVTRDPQQQCLFNCKECPLEKSKNEEILEPCKGHLKRKIIKECWSKCGCNKQCGNRVVQRGINYKLQVFFTPDGKGWGLRTLEKLPKGAFVCEFVGEIMTIAELYKRTSEKHAYPVILDAYWGSEEVLKDSKALCLDAMYYGNVARFINHRCLDANLVEIPVQVETPEQHYYHFAFFTTREVDALEELTWDYGIDFDDHDHPVKTFRCLCGSKFCRNMKRVNRSKYALNGR